MGRPPKFSRERVQQVALALVDEHGVEGLSMRAVAQALQTGPMTLYNHVTDRAHLEVLVVDAVLAEAAAAFQPQEDWRAEAEAMGLAVWRAMRAHPRAVPLVLTCRTRSEPVLALAEGVLNCLAKAGLKGEALLVGFRAVTAFVMGFAQAELAGPLAVDPEEPLKERIARIRALPKERFPRLIEAAGQAARSDVEREFKQGLRALLRGLRPEGP